MHIIEFVLFELFLIKINSFESVKAMSINVWSYFIDATWSRFSLNFIDIFFFLINFRHISPGAFYKIIVSLKYVRNVRFALFTGTTGPRRSEYKSTATAEVPLRWPYRSVHSWYFRVHTKELGEEAQRILREAV